MANPFSEYFGPRPSPRVVSVQTRGAPTPPMPYMPGAAGGGAQPGGVNNAFGNLNIQDLLRRFEEGSNSANQANLGRYNNLMSSVAGTNQNVRGAFDQASGLLSTMGDSARTRIGTDRTQNLARSEQDLVTRGLGNTTIRESARRGINSDAERANQAVDEQVAGARSGLLTQRAGAELGLGHLTADSILSRQDTGPDAGMYSSLMQALAAAGGGGGGAGGMGGGATPQLGAGPEMFSDTIKRLPIQPGENTPDYYARIMPQWRH